MILKIVIEYNMLLYGIISGDPQIAQECPRFGSFFRIVSSLAYYKAIYDACK